MKILLIICLITAISFQASYAQEGKVYFRDITTENGLPNNTVFCITQDKQGFIWLATADGLVRYDGYTCKIYPHDPDDPQSISQNALRSVFEDSNGNLWIGTIGEGLNRFDHEKEIFIRYKSDKNDSTSLSHNSSVKAIYEDKQGKLWIGTGYGLNLYDAQNDRFIRYTHNKNDPNSINPDAIHSIYEDSRNNFWVATTGGLELFNRKTGKVVHFRYNPIDPTSICGNNIRYMFEDSEGVFWVGTTAGYNHLIFEGDKIIFNRVKSKDGRSFNCKTKKAYDLYERKGSQKLTKTHHLTDFVDRQGNIWIGTRFEGIMLYTARDGFFTYKYDPDDPEKLRFWPVDAICESTDGNLWIGVGREGLHYYNRANNCFTHFPLYYKSPNNQFPGNVWALKEDSYGDLWIGTFGFGVLKLDKKSGKLIHYMPEKNNPASFNSYVVRSIFEDSRQNIWIGTNGEGVNLYNRKNNNFSQIKMVEKSNAIIDSTDYSNYVNHIYEDSKENLWFATRGGLYIYDRDNKTSRKWNPNWNDTVIANNIYIEIIYEDSKGNLWFGAGNGLFLFNKEDDVFTNYKEKDGLPSSIIKGILEDNQGNLWISTFKGISKFNPENKTFMNYYVDDGLQGDDFYHRACSKLKTGELVFGGKNGFTIFHPDSIKDFKIVPPRVVITDFQIFNKTIKPGETNSPLYKSIGFTDEITLPYHQHSVSFEFAVLDYINPKRNQYKYMLEGFNKDWIETPADLRIATFTNLSPGTYVFRVIGANSKDIWNLKGASVKIIITPPFWKTTWAYMFYVFLTAFIIWLLWKAQMRRVQIRQELHMKQFETEKLHELDHMKSRFFANISHEFRTPLTLLLGPVEDLLKSKSDRDEKERGIFKMMQRNIKRLQVLINQLLDLSKLETGKIKLQVSEGNLSEFIRRIVLSFLSLAESKNINYKYDIPDLSCPVYFDADKVEKIIINLISNAFKFTSAYGNVNVRLQYDTSVETGIPEFVDLCVSDTGKGIPEEKLNKIFDRFYQVIDSNTRDAEGSGVGLALTKELIDLYRGKISVESKVGKGSTFSVKLPISKEQFKEEEIVTITSDEELSKPQKIQEESELTEMEESQNQEKTKELPVILIVEDNIDLRNYISESLCNSYQIITAENGKQGLELAIESIPDLVVSDLMMPVMNGIEMCKHLKTDERTNHIPLVMLTARADRESKIEGLETGADDYIVKPFDTEELQIRIKNLIEQRNKLQEKFRKEFFTPDKMEISLTKNDQLIKKLFELFEENYSDFNFSIEDMSRKLNMSRTQFFRKVNAFIGESPNELLRLYRMKKAAALIQSGKNNIIGIMYEVGFRSTSHFATSFKKYYGQNPSEYRDRIRRS